MVMKWTRSYHFAGIYFLALSVERSYNQWWQRGSQCAPSTTLSF
jgi:hypothetical protein